jgi:hypothetical protein
MAWRLTQFLIEGELDNTQPDKVTGWMSFTGMKDKMTFNLEGNFHRDIRGAKIHFTGDGKADNPQAAAHMDGLAQHQTGKVGDITAGLPPHDYGHEPYVEWYGVDNGRVVIEPEPNRIAIIGSPIPFIESDPISRTEQRQNMAEFLGEMAKAVDIPVENAISTDGVTVQVRGNEVKRGHKLLTEELRRQLPALYAQESKGGKAIAYAKFFTPDSGFTWYASEFDGEDTFFGLVDGQFKELGYFSLTELETTTGPMGLPIERDLWFKPTPLEKIAPELFRNEENGR